MKVTSKFQILGCKGSQGEYEGVKYDKTVLYVVMDVSETSGKEVGYNVKEIKYGLSGNFEQLKNLQYPLTAELELELNTKGYECQGFKVIRPESASPAKG